jgi:hypothetical protein
MKGIKGVQQLRILVTGSAGLIGRAVTPLLRAERFAVVPFDLRADPPHDIADVEALRRGLHGIDGIIHLAGVSRVIDGERDPDRCRRINVEATRALFDLANKSASVPWFIQASSREVYGQQDVLPVKEDAPLRPCNVYAHSKVAVEQLAETARAAGLTTAILRFSNVFATCWTIRTGWCRRSRAPPRRVAPCGSTAPAAPSTSPTSRTLPTAFCAWCAGCATAIAPCRRSISCRESKLRSASSPIWPWSLAGRR